ncbi:hypothetical protein [Variovorax guangxiensis]|uniref:hypothetical protein n=1 Tax=Variovorax guangxiensis TaxID=1775474 RepID=UPI00197D4BC2|nr:hypothetical protein [Variovorax guangxiensis]
MDTLAGAAAGTRRPVSGKAELRQGRRTRCVLVLTQCPTREAALDLFQLRAQSYIGGLIATRAETSEEHPAQP